MNFDYSKLKGRIIEKYDSVSNFADNLNIAQSGLYTTLKSGRPFSVKMIVLISKSLNISHDDIGLYFFTHKV